MELPFNLRNIIPVLLGLILYFTLVPAILMTLVVNELVRFIISKLLWTKYKGTIELIPDGGDAIWCHVRKGNTRNILVYAVTPKDELNVNVLMKMFEKRVLDYKDVEMRKPYEKIKRTIVTKYGYPCWKKDSKFTLKNHFRVMDKNKVYSESDVKLHLANLSQDMDDTKPQWELIVFPVYQDGDGTEKSFLILRFHHAYLDGFSFIQFVSNQLASGFDHYIHPAEFGLPLWKTLLMCGNMIFQGPFALLMYLKQSFLSWETPKWSTKNNKETHKSQRIFSWTKSIPHESIKKIQMKTHKASVSHVISSAFAIGLKKVLPSHAALLPEILMGETLALPPYPSDQPVNRLMAYCFPVLTKNEEPLQKIKETRKSSLEMMTGPQPLLYYLMFKVFGRFPRFVVQKLLSGMKHSVSITNVPGSRSRFSIFGDANLLEFGTWPPQVNDGGIVLASVTYNERMRVCANADSSWLKKEELEDIMAAIPRIVSDMCHNL